MAYMENGVEKTSYDEWKRLCEIDDYNKRLNEHYSHTEQSNEDYFEYMNDYLDGTMNV